MGNKDWQCHVVQQMSGYRTEHESAAARLTKSPHDQEVHFLITGMVQQLIADGEAGGGEYLIEPGRDLVACQVGT